MVGQMEMQTSSVIKSSWYALPHWQIFSLSVPFCRAFSRKMSSMRSCLLSFHSLTSISQRRLRHAIALCRSMLPCSKLYHEKLTDISSAAGSILQHEFVHAASQ